MEPAIPIPLQQHPNFAATLTRLGRETRAIELDGAAPVQTIRRFGLRFASRGPVWDSAPTEARSSAMRQAGLHLINSDGGDDCVLKRAGFRRIAAPVEVAEWSLDGSRQDRMARMKGKWRNALRRGLEADQSLQFERFAPRRHHWLLEADLRQQKAKGFRSLPHSFLIAYAEVNPDTCCVFTAYSKGQPVAAMLFLVHGTVATYHLGWTSEAGRKLRSHHALLMRAGDKLSKQGVTRIDLGTLDRVDAPGLARFKIGTGAVIRKLGGTWVKVPLL